MPSSANVPIRRQRSACRTCPVPSWDRTALARRASSTSCNSESRPSKRRKRRVRPPGVRRRRRTKGVSAPSYRRWRRAGWGGSRERCTDRRNEAEPIRFIASGAACSHLFITRGRCTHRPRSGFVAVPPADRTGPPVAPGRHGMTRTSAVMPTLAERAALASPKQRRDRFSRWRGGNGGSHSFGAQRRGRASVPPIRIPTAPPAASVSGRRSAPRDDDKGCRLLACGGHGR